jgi:hypothetical protein
VVGRHGKSNACQDQDFQALKANKALCWLTLRWSARCTYVPKNEIHLVATYTGRSMVGLEASIPAEGGRNSGEGNGRRADGMHEMRLARPGLGSTRSAFLDSHDRRDSGMVVDRSSLSRTGGLRLRLPVLRQPRCDNLARVKVCGDREGQATSGGRGGLRFQSDVADAAYQVISGGPAVFHGHDFDGRGLVVGAQDEVISGNFDVSHRANIVF